MLVTVYQVPNSYVSSGGTVNVISVFTLEVSDDDGLLHGSEALDPGASQNLTLFSGSTPFVPSSYTFIYNDSINWSNGGPSTAETVKTFQLTFGSTTLSFIMNDAGGDIPGMTTGSTVSLNTFSGYTPVPYSQFPCFCPGTLIRSRGGARPVETLRAGDEVWTLDSGWQRILWAGASPLTQRALLARPEIGPLVIPAGALGTGRPARDLVVSPQHRVLVAGWRVELASGRSEAFVPARHLADGGIARPAPIGPEGATYHHIMFERHEIVESEGLLTESFHPGETIREGMCPETLADLRALHSGPEWARRLAAPLARPVLRRYESALLAA